LNSTVIKAMQSHLKYHIHPHSTTFIKLNNKNAIPNMINGRKQLINTLNRCQLDPKRFNDVDSRKQS